MEMPAGLLSQLVAAVPDDEFRQLSDKLILSLLRSEHDQVRKTISLKCACACNSERLSRILLAYIDGTDQHYYNVIHWLDFALSIPADRMLSIARDVLRHQASLD
ncbi:hypothetical protein [Cupriavidus oxalaticus]|uniref:Uncharacterized protein n=1 Tax=Cupriavidus oxalaticus TaxID=96344 RepID=A0A4V1BZI8_9BURK|nr:hypothetical protein [Cupriavidus oxalaticus]QBY55472.1 hypothetical protein E0W60_31030 [Cupriavidus oxalaticus]